MAEGVTESDLEIHERQQRRNKKMKEEKQSSEVGSFTNNSHQIVMNYLNFCKRQHTGMSNLAFFFKLPNVFPSQ